MSVREEAKKLGLNLTKSVSIELDKYDTAKGWITEITNFLNEHGLDNASIDVESHESYYNEVEIKVNIVGQVKKTDKELEKAIASRKKYLKDVASAELNHAKKKLKKV